MHAIIVIHIVVHACEIVFYAWFYIVNCIEFHSGYELNNWHDIQISQNLKKSNNKILVHYLRLLCAHGVLHMGHFVAWFWGETNPQRCIENTPFKVGYSLLNNARDGSVLFFFFNFNFQFFHSFFIRLSKVRFSIFRFLVRQTTKLKDCILLSAYTSIIKTCTILLLVNHLPFEASQLETGNQWSFLKIQFSLQISR